MVSGTPSDSPSFWWINQGRAYDWESAGGYVYAGKFTSDGRIVQHHSDLLKLAPGDVILHAARGLLQPGRRCHRFDGKPSSTAGSVRLGSR
jgi:hypothetical protein